MAMQTATNPQTGETVALVNNQWVPVGQTATNNQGQKAYLVNNQWMTDKPTTPQEQGSTDRTFGEAFKDVGAGLVSGVGSLVQVPGQLYGLATGDFSPTGSLGLGEDISQYAEEMKSEGLKAREANRSAKVQEAEKGGQWEAFKAGFGETITDPALVTSFLAEQAPQIIPMILTGGASAAFTAGRASAAALAKGATKEAAASAAKQAGVKAGTTAAIQTGAVMQGADVGAGAYDDIYRELRAKGLSEEDAAAETINKARAAGLAGYGLSVVANRYLPGSKALEEILAGKAITGSRIASGAATALKEIPGENIEEVGGKIAQNVAAQQAGLDRELLAGTGETAALATIGAAGMGGAAGAAAKRTTAADKTEQVTDAFKQEEEQFRKEFGQTEPVKSDAEAPVSRSREVSLDVTPPAVKPFEAPPQEAPTELPGGYTATRRETSRKKVYENFGIFAQGSESPLTTVTSQEEADAKLQTLTEIRQQEQSRLAAESEKISAGINAGQRKIDVMEATGLTGTDEYIQAKAALEQQSQEATQKIDELTQKIADYSAPLSINPLGTRVDVQSEFDLNKGNEAIGTFQSLEEAEAALRQREPELFKQADETARVAKDERFETLKQTLSPLLAKFNLQDVGLNIVDKIQNDAGGSYLDKLIQVAIDEQNPIQTMRHESMHALKDLQFFTPQQWKVLTEKANKEWIKTYLADVPTEFDGVQMSRLDAYKKMGLTQEELIEEAISDAFGAYDKGATPPPGMIAALYKKLKNFFLNFGQALRGAGFESADDVFQRVERGELKSRKPQARAKAEPTVKPKAEPKAAEPTEEKELTEKEPAKKQAPATEEATKEEPSPTPKYSLSGEGVPMSTRKLMENQTAVAQQDIGLNTEAKRGRFNNVRDIAKALNKQTLDQFGEMDRNNLTQQESTMISEAIADEVAYQLQTSSKTGTGLGWYSNNYPNAVKRLGKRFPELSTSKYARSVFSALVAVTSNGERVAKNIDNAIKLYGDLRKGKPLVAMGNRRATALENNLQVIEDLMAEHGENFENVLLQEITVKEMNSRLREMGEKTDGSYLANTVVPAAAVYFGPKLGAFYANLSGSEGYLTMDLWWTRSINRMRGLLIPKATEASIGKFRDMMEQPDATRDEVTAASIPLRNKYEEYGWNSELEHLVEAKEPATKDAKPAWFKKAEEVAGDAYEQLLFEHNLEKMANTIYKNEFEMLEEAPFTATDRKFMYDAARKAQTLLRKDGIDLSLADIQAALWYYEKRLYEKLSGRKADDIGYEEAIIAQANQGSGRARPSLVFDKGANRGDDAAAKVSDTKEVRGELDRGKKLSLRTSFATAKEAEDAAYDKAPPSTKEFKLFFGGSIIMDEGRPQPMYHGSASGFDTFNESKPIFVSPDPDFAEQFAEDRVKDEGKSSDEMRIYPLWVRAETPFDYENQEHAEMVANKIITDQNLAGDDSSVRLKKSSPKAGAFKKEIADGLWSAIEDPVVQDALKSLGFDSFYVQEQGNKNLAVFKAEQVKSITGNVGDFSLESKDMRFSLKKVRYSPNRFDKLWNESMYTQNDAENKTKGYLAFVNPMEFVRATSSPETFERLLREQEPLDLARMNAYDQVPFLSVSEKDGNWKITGHEGRHRMLALNEAGYREVPVYIHLRAESAESIPAKALTAQDADSMSSVLMAAEVEPLSYANKQKAMEKFTRMESKVKYSLPTMPANIETRIGETTFKREEKGFVERMIAAISPSSAASFRAQFLNRYNQMSVYDKKLAEQMGGSALLADQSAESAALMSDLGAGIAASAMGLGDRNGGIPVLRNGITTIDRNTKGLIASLAPLAAYGDPAVYQRYQYWAMVKRGQRLNKEGKLTGIDSADVAFAKALEAKHPEFVSVQKDLIAFNNGLVQYMVDTGVLSKERGQLYTKYADYIPFYRQMDGDNTLGPNLFQSLSGVKPPKKLKGADAAEAPLADFLETMVRNTQSAIQAGVKNYAAQRAIDVALQIKAPGMGASRLNVASTAPNVINVLQKGQLVSYETPDTLLINAMKSLNQSELPFMGILSGPANLLRNLVTKDPGFMMANLLRDSLSAWVTSGVPMTPIAGTVINFGKALARKSPGFEAMQDAGIIGGYEFSENVEQSGIKLQKDLDKKAGKKAPIYFRPFTSVWDALETGTTASDAATRALIYERVLADTGNEAEALYRSLEVMNFHRKGSSPLIRVLTAAVPFFNARLQGLDLFYRASTGNMNNKDAAAIQRQFWARGMTMMALSTAYWFMVSDDEEYKKQEQETKDNNWLIPSIGAKIPIPFEVGVLFKVIPERIAAYTFGNDTGQDLVDSLKRNAMSTFAFNPIPQTVKPVLEASFNFNTFTWRPIVSKGMEGVATEFQVGPSTSKVAQELGNALGLSPMKVDHILKGYTGTMGMYAIDTLDIVMDQFGDSPKPSKRFEQLPVIKRFALDPEARGNITQYYQLKDAVDTTVRTMNILEKTGESEEYVKYLQENVGTLAYKDYVRDVEKTMKELRQMRVAIRSSKMSGDEKRDALVEITRVESAITSQIQNIKKSIAKYQ